MNQNENVIAGFGDEWERFNQSSLDTQERRHIFDSYFAVFPWGRLPSNAVGFDLGCGSGRWAIEFAQRLSEGGGGHLHCIDPSSAIEVAKRNLVGVTNCSFHQAPVDSMPLEDASMDFGYSLGVLHHVPDTQAGITACVLKLKPGAPLLLYLYYAFDNRPFWFRLLWRSSDVIRQVISRLPHSLRYASSQVLAMLIYWPLARTSSLFERLGFGVSLFPLSAYRDKSFYTMRTDALDRFGTRLEQRFSRSQIKKMMETAGLENILFSNAEPYWCAVGFKKA